jgi:hypothetical protein
LKKTSFRLSIRGVRKDLVHGEVGVSASGSSGLVLEDEICYGPLSARNNVAKFIT